MRPTATLVADAGPASGLGHVSRATAASVALRCHGWDVRTLTVGAPGPVHVAGLEWKPAEEDPQAWARGAAAVVVDSYSVPAPALERLAAAVPLVLFHDAGGPQPPESTRLVVSLAGSGDGWAHGPEYACLRPQFWGIAASTARADVQRVLVAVGSGALGGGGEIAAAVAGALPSAEVRLVVGPYAPEGAPGGVVAVPAPDGLLAELRAADLVITAAGQTLLEGLCAGAPCVAYAHADNQRAQLELLAAGGGTVATEPEHIVATAVDLAGDAARRLQLVERGRALVDGFGALRVAARMSAS